jgi:hypothetical protein
MRPSSEVASLSVSHGRPRVTRDRKPALSAAASSASTPVVTATPASLSRARPRPSTRGSGSISGTTTRATPAASSASVQGGVRPVVGAGLERDVGRGAAGARAGRGECLGLGVGAAARPGDAAPDHAAVRDNHAAHRRVRPDAAEAAVRQAERRAHPAGVRVRTARGCVRHRLSRRFRRRALAVAVRRRIPRNRRRPGSSCRRSRSAHRRPCRSAPASP